MYAYQQCTVFTSDNIMPSLPPSLPLTHTHTHLKKIHLLIISVLDEAARTINMLSNFSLLVPTE